MSTTQPIANGLTLTISEKYGGAEYTERAGVMKKQADIAEVPLILKEWANFHGAAQDIQSGTINGANSSRAIGIHLQTWCGKENISFMFWKTHCEKVLPFDFDAAKFFMSVARKMSKKAETIAEAWPFSQQCLTFDGLLPLAERTGPQHRNPIPPLQKLFCQFAMLRKPFKKINGEIPMDDWDREDVRLFLSETEWLADEREKAELLLKEAK